MVTMTLVVELPDNEAHASQIMRDLSESFIDGTSCHSVLGFGVLDMGFGNNLARPMTFTTTETKEST